MATVALRSFDAGTPIRKPGAGPPRECGHARTLKGSGPTLSDADYRTRFWLWLGAGHRVGIQNLPAGRPPPQTADGRGIRGGVQKGP